MRAHPSFATLFRFLAFVSCLVGPCASVFLVDEFLGTLRHGGALGQGFGVGRFGLRFDFCSLLAGLSIESHTNLDAK